jgi:hypothetical protein
MRQVLIALSLLMITTVGASPGPSVPGSNVASTPALSATVRTGDAPKPYGIGPFSIGQDRPGPLAEGSNPAWATILPMLQGFSPHFEAPPNSRNTGAAFPFLIRNTCRIHTAIN